MIDLKEEFFLNEKCMSAHEKAEDMYFFMAFGKNELIKKIVHYNERKTWPEEYEQLKNIHPALRWRQHTSFNLRLSDLADDMFCANCTYYEDDPEVTYCTIHGISNGMDDPEEEEFGGLVCDDFKY